ncbi:hypothetical protein U8C40_06765 [Sinorhizobium medicae]|nr:hypothetical protein U8C40_06765 [Sinorhizobium medicae]
MDDRFIFAASSVCLITGIALCFLPANKYARTTSVGMSGALFLVCGVVLMTTFKWTEVAFKVSEVEVKIAKALKERDEALAVAAARENSLKAVASAAEPESQDKAIDEILRTVYISENDELDRMKAYTKFKTALEDNNFTVVPTSALPNDRDSLDPSGSDKQAPAPTFQ